MLGHPHPPTDDLAGTMHPRGGPHTEARDPAGGWRGSRTHEGRGKGPRTCVGCGAGFPVHTRLAGLAQPAFRCSFVPSPLSRLSTTHRRAAFSAMVTRPWSQPIHTHSQAHFLCGVRGRRGQAPRPSQASTAWYRSHALWPPAPPPGHTPRPLAIPFLSCLPLRTPSTTHLSRALVMPFPSCLPACLSHTHLDPPLWPSFTPATHRMSLTHNTGSRTSPVF